VVPLPQRSARYHVARQISAGLVLQF